MIDRVYNVCKGEKRKHDDQGSSKKPKITDRYPPLSLVEVCDDVTDTRNIGALEKELKKPKPNKVVVLELMEQTFSFRQQFVV